MQEGEKKLRVVLAGNPNCGKTTLFNRLTGDHQYVGNWPGVTVEKKTGGRTGSWGTTRNNGFARGIFLNAQFSRGNDRGPPFAERGDGSRYRCG